MNGRPCPFDLSIIDIWRNAGGIPFDRSTVEYAWSLIQKLEAENRRLLDELTEVTS